MTGNEMRNKLHNGEHVYGTMIISESPRWPGIVSSAGLDFVFIDTEHIALDRQKVSWMCQLYAALGIVPVVRIPSPDPYIASMMYDGGAQGVIAPYVETPEQARQLVGAAKYRPLKGGRLTDALSGATPLEPELKDYLDKRNENNIAIVNIESIPAIEALDDILAVEGLDAVLIGPHDLSCNLGIPEQYFDDKYISAVEEIIIKARKKGIGAGIHMVYPNSREYEIKWAKMAVNLVVHSIDMVLFRNTIHKDIEDIKAAVEGKADGDKLEDINV
jgi:4-hydroxy-2-oxoheptanedioate aldolase